MGKKIMRRIIIVTTSFPDEAFKPGQEAAGMFVFDFAQELAKHAHVAVVAPGKKNNIESFINFLVYRFSVPSLPLSLLKPANPMQWHKIIETLQAGQLVLQNTVIAERPDHIFALWALPSGYWARAVGKKYSIPYSIWALGSDIWDLGKIPFIRTFLRDVLRDSQVCFADGYQLASDVETISGRKCHFLPSSRKLPVTSIKDVAIRPPYKLAFLGRWHPNKGIDLLLESLFLLDDADWKRIVAVHIYGGGPLEQLVHTQVDSLRVLDRPVEVGGYLNREKATELLVWADYLLLPSRIESIPIIFSDALQTRCPLVSTPVGDLPRLLNTYQVGVLAKNVTAVSYACAIQKIINTNPHEYVTGLLHAYNQFSVGTSAKQLLDYLNNPHLG